jgi:hypothetical protein
VRPPEYAQRGDNMSRHHSVAELKAALVQHYGAITLAAQSVDMTPQGLYKRIKGSPELRETCEAARARLFETALLQLQVLVREGNFAAIKHALLVTKEWDFLSRNEVEANEQATPPTPAKVGPELQRAIERIVDILGAGGATSLIGPTDVLPPGFAAPH